MINSRSKFDALPVPSQRREGIGRSGAVLRSTRAARNLIAFSSNAARREER